MSLMVPANELADLEDQVQRALASGSGRGLDVLGYGEITLVLRLTTEQGSFACKRLPIFPERRRLEAYRRSLDTYLDRLADRGLHAAETVLWTMTLPDGKVVAYCIQEALPPERLCSKLLHTQSEAWAEKFFARFLDHVDDVVLPDLGLDAQASNWTDVDGTLHYLDVTTPMMRDRSGREVLDVRLFFSSLPWAVRDAVRIGFGKSIFDKFYDKRGVVVDFLGNLHKERLTHLIPGFVTQANDRLGRNPITASHCPA